MRTVSSKPAATPEKESQLVVEEPDNEEADEGTDRPEKKSKKTEDDSPAEESEEETSDAPSKISVKKTKGGKSSKASKAKKAKGEKAKRGPARPYRKLPQDVLDLRIQKLKKRIERTTSQAEDGKNFLSKYVREQSFRESEGAKADD
jgi:hypothetical protein